MKRISQHAEWLSLIDRSGSFLSVSVLERVFPQGLESVELTQRRTLRSAYDEWCEAKDVSDPKLAELHTEWIRIVLTEILEYEDRALHVIDRNADHFKYAPQEQSGSFTSDYYIGKDGEETPRMFVAVTSPDVDIEKTNPADGWPVSIVDRMILTCRHYKVPIGLLTNGERWTLVYAPVGESSSHTSWYARLWFQEPITLKAFQSLLGVRRCFGPKEDTLEKLLEESARHQEEVTDTLGEQVRRAVEVLIQCLDRADQDRNRELLKDVSPAELYEAGLTVMMRLVFVLCAEERDLLLLGEPIYDQCYAISTLRATLAEEASRHGPEVLERRYDAWTRLLATFRGIYGGIEHETLRLPALGGSIFDPDRFPFLEGRAKGTTWKEAPAHPLPIDNRTVMLLLEALQLLEQRGGALLLSYKALDVEQIGHVYEGLLEYTVHRLPKVTLGLEGSQKAQNPNLTLDELEAAGPSNGGAVETLVKDATQRSESAIRKALSKEADDETFAKVMIACGGDAKLAERIRPFMYLLRSDAWDDFIVYKAHSFAVTLGANRRETGTHYTPKSLTEPIVQHTLEPLVYSGPSEGMPRTEWKLKSPAELLDLKVCDMAMGSGAFLVQACRYLGERLVESWELAEQEGKAIAFDGRVLDELGDAEAMPKVLDDRLLIARRMIASRGLYGVDINPLAVELGKLSLWLVTMMKNRPFGFLDHALKSGDSLLGISTMSQLENFSLRQGCKQLTFATADLFRFVEQAGQKRRELEELPSNDYVQIENKNRLHGEAEAATTKVKALADCLIALELRGLDGAAYANARETEAERIQRQLKQGSRDVRAYASEQLRGHKPFHWPVEYPEVFARGGFDAFVGNPPFMGGQKITGVLGTGYRRILVTVLAKGRRGSADLSGYFVLRSSELIRLSGQSGLLATNTIAQGETRQVTLDYLVNSAKFVITTAISSRTWPGRATVYYAFVCLRNGLWKGLYLLDDVIVEGITPYLTEPTAVEGKPFKLKSNRGWSFQGSILLGMGFVLEPEEAKVLLAADPRNKEVLYPYLIGEDFNSAPDQKPGRWAIQFDERTEQESREYVAVWRLAEERIKPERQEKDAKKYPRMVFEWWKHWNNRRELREATRRMPRVVALSRITNHLGFAFVPSDIVFGDRLAVFAFSAYFQWAVLQSSFHYLWAWKYSVTNLALLSYSPTDCFETFPLPLGFTEAEKPISVLESVGRAYYELRSRIMISHQEGLTKTYNRFHDRDEQSEDIVRLRELHVKMDLAVAAAYGWSDLDLGHGFHATKQGERYTISESARRKVLDRLLSLNHQRYEEEVKQGLHDKKKMKAKAKGITTDNPAQHKLL